MNIKRSSGILMHISSLPSDFGIGDFGSSAYKFVDFLAASGHHFWQLLPLNPTNESHSHSPYSSFSAFAGNPLLISPQLIEKQGFLHFKNFQVPKEVSDKKVDFKKVQQYKEELFDVAFQNFRKEKTKDFIQFCESNSGWLEDFSLYKVLKDQFQQKSWTNWPSEFKNREKNALKKLKINASDEIEKIKFIQYLFFTQWEKLKSYAHKKGVQIIGDIPFYVNHDSADCWANPEYFKLDAHKDPTHVAGVPPDYFSETGQLWGNPVYDWQILKKQKFDWWIERLRQNLGFCDIVRIDHFRAFSAYWEVDAGEETAMNGKWVQTPGISFFEKVREAFPEMPFIAEDLGTLDEGVFELMNKYNFPGMKILHFAFGDDYKDNPYLPFNHSPNNIVYTGTHDNNTSIGWYKNLRANEKQHLRKFSMTGITKKNVHQVLHKMALNSVAKLAIVPLQDILGLGEESIMNKPGTTKGNWDWRATKEEIANIDIQKLKSWNEIYGRW